MRYGKKGQTMAFMPMVSSGFPIDPLEQLASRAEYRQNLISGILESYNSNYDVFAEVIQNAIDAIEDARLSNLGPPYVLEVTIHLGENWLGILDTGIGMNNEQIKLSFAPSVSFKNNKELIEKRGAKNAYRGYKGVGLTFLAYGTDDVVIHSRQEGASLTKGRMQYGRAWVYGDREEPSQIVEDDRPSPLEKYSRGTYVQVHFSSYTRPKSLPHLASNPDVWPTILRTRTAIGQILLGREALTQLDIRLTIINAGGSSTMHTITPSFLFPHNVERSPAFRFLDLPDYWETYGEHTEPPTDKLRQDGLFLTWDTKRIREELSKEHQIQFKYELDTYLPCLYGFIPYQGSLWGEINSKLSGRSDRSHLYPGLMVAVNRQRLADIFDIEASRFEVLSRNILVIVHFDNAKPDQGRKTLQDEVLDLAKKAADRAVQYLAKQRKLLRAPGESPTPEQRQIERNHDDWIFNVKTHAISSPLHLPPATFVSIPLTEQDVIGLFHQLSALGVFAGIKIYATSQSHTYDCLVRYDCANDTKGLRYADTAVEKYPLGLSPYILGIHDRFSTGDVTLEFKNNLDSLIAEMYEEGAAKNFNHINICVCWSMVDDNFKGYSVEKITETNLDARQYPGVTHILHRDGDSHVIQIIMLKRIIDMIQAGYMQLGHQ
jgi:hypothetical protein